jgi:hypothetical protein
LTEEQFNNLLNMQVQIADDLFDKVRKNYRTGVIKLDDETIDKLSRLCLIAREIGENAVLNQD